MDANTVQSLQPLVAECKKQTTVVETYRNKENTAAALAAISFLLFLALMGGAFLAEYLGQHLMAVGTCVVCVSFCASWVIFSVGKDILERRRYKAEKKLIGLQGRAIDVFLTGLLPQIDP